VYLFIGLLDHSPWKYEDAVHLGVAWDMVQSGHWLQPHLAGEAWNEAPLYYWLAALMGQTLGSLIGFHNAARLATAFFGIIILYALGRTSSLILSSQRQHSPYSTQPPRFDAAAPLLLIGAPGLLLPMHEAQPMIAVLAGHALAYWGLARLPQQRNGGITLAIGLIVTTLAGGYDALLPLAALALLPLLFSDWRNRNALLGCAIAIALAAGVLAIAAAVLSLPALSSFKPQISLDHAELLAWFAWPALPLALWPLWLHRRQLGQIALPLLGSLGALVWYLLCSEARNLPALPVLLPLVLLAATGAGRLRRGAANALDWFGMMTFTLFGVLIWVAEAALLTGSPPKLHKNITRLIPGYESDISLVAWVFAAAISVLWLVIIFSSRRSPWRGTTNWACGMVLIWCVFAALWVSPVDYGKSYAAMSKQIATTLGTGENRCVSSQGLGNAQRAALHYHAGLITQRGRAGKQCDWLLVQGHPKRAPKVDAEWTRVWEGARPSDRDDRYYLYRR
jgi:4-amino-4-deoxy-L-arabinose transferase-like glycosyltransferase